MKAILGFCQQSGASCHRKLFCVFWPALLETIC